MKLADNPRFNPGEVVYAKEAPGTALTIRRYVDRIYYCQVSNDPQQKERVYFDHELTNAKPWND